MGLGRSSREILRYAPEKQHAGTVRRHYLRWRSEQDPPMPQQCDIAECHFHTAPLVWNCKPVKLILDHRNGVNSDNRPENLRLLCPLCNDQLDTNAGGNKGRVKKSSGGFAEKRGGEWSHTLPAEAGRIALSESPVEMTIIRAPSGPGIPEPRNSKKPVA